MAPSQLSGAYLNLHSHLRSEYKTGLLHTRLYRTYNICSNYTNLHQEIVCLQSHCMKSVQICSYFWSVFSCIQSEYRKLRTRNKSLVGHFSRNNYLLSINVFLNNSFLKRHHLKSSSEKKEVIISLEVNWQQLTDIFRSCHENVKFTVVFKSPNRIRNAICFREQLPKKIKYIINMGVTLPIMPTLVKLNDIF